jgi:hypothetical protein
VYAKIGAGHRRAIFREQFRREWTVAVAASDGGPIGILLAIDANQRIVSANRAARTSLMLDDRGLRAGVSLWTIFERDPDLFRRKDRTDIYRAALWQRTVLSDRYMSTGNAQTYEMTRWFISAMFLSREQQPCLTQTLLS